MSAGKHPECSPDGCCINSIPVHSGSCPNFLTKNQLCLCFSVPQPLPLAGLALGHPGACAHQSVQGLQGWWAAPAAACLLSVCSIKREQRQGSGNNRRPIQVYRRVCLHLAERLLSGTRPPTPSPIHSGACGESAPVGPAGPAPPSLAGEGAGSGGRAALPGTGEPTHIRAAGDSALLSLFLAVSAVHYL